MLTPPYWCWLRVPLRWIGCKVKKVFPQSWTVFQSLFYFALQENRTEKLSQKSLSRVASFDGDFFEKLFPTTKTNWLVPELCLSQCLPHHHLFHWLEMSITQISIIWWRPMPDLFEEWYQFLTRHWFVSNLYFRQCWPHHIDVGWGLLLAVDESWQTMKY